MGSDPQAYLQKMAEKKTEGDELTLFALAEVHALRIHLISSAETDSNVYYIIEHSAPVRDVWLGYLRNCHYWSLIEDATAMTALTPREAQWQRLF
jgi:hypothetical protein